MEARNRFYSGNVHPAGRLRWRLPMSLAYALFIVALTAAEVPAQTGGYGAGTPTLFQGRTLTLEESITTALERNRGLIDARYALEVAEEQVREARGLALPSVSANARFTRSITPLESFLPARIFNQAAPGDEFVAVRFGADNNWNSTITFDQPLFDYRVIIGLQAAGTARRLAVETLRGTAQQTATAVRKAFYAVLLARESYRLTENSVQRLRQTLEETRARNRVGLASEYDVLRLEVELGNLEPQLRKSDDALEAARRQLALILGVPVDTGFDVAGNLMDLDVETREADSPESGQLFQIIGEPQALALGFETVMENALGNRTDIRQTQINRLLGEAQLKASFSQHYPTLSGFYSLSVTAQENDAPDFFGEGSGQRTSLQQAGLQVQIPLFSGFRRSARVQQDRLTLRRISIQLDQLREQAVSEVRTLLDALEETRLRAIAQARAVEQARKGFEIASAQYREGVSSRLEVVDAENALRQAEFNYAQAVFDHLNAHADLDLAAGRVPLVDVIGG